MILLFNACGFLIFAQQKLYLISEYVLFSIMTFLTKEFNLFLQIFTALYRKGEKSTCINSCLRLVFNLRQVLRQGCLWNDWEISLRMGGRSSSEQRRERHRMWSWLEPGSSWPLGQLCSTQNRDGVPPGGKGACLLGLTSVKATGYLLWREEGRNLTFPCEVPQLLHTLHPTPICTHLSAKAPTDRAVGGH